MWLWDGIVFTACEFVLLSATVSIVTNVGPEVGCRRGAAGLGY